MFAPITPKEARRQSEHVLRRGASRNCDWITGKPEVILRSACKVGVFGNN